MSLVDTLVLWLHLVAAAVWVGGILFLGLVLLPASKGLIQDPIARSRFVAKIGARFNLVGWASLMVLGGTGLLNLLRVSGGLDGVMSLLSSRYGIVLNTKLVFVAIMIALTAHHTFLSGPRVRKLIQQLESGSVPEDHADHIRDNIRRLQRTNGILMGVLGVLALATLFMASVLVLPI